jgi:ABC-type polysaccharide/polyol phosphate export permease
MEVTMQALKEIWTSIAAWKIWLHIGLEDVVGRYRRTVLGPLWIVISQCAFIFGIYFIRHSISGGNDNNFLLYLSISIPAWNLIASFLIEGSGALLRSKGYIESYPLPIPIFIIRVVFAALVNFAHLLVVFVIVALITQITPSLNWLAFIPGLIIVLVFGLGLSLGLSSLGARFRDLGPAMASIVGLMFVLSPVFWVPTPEQLRSPIVQWNPFFYLLEVIREPLLSTSLTPSTWLVAIGLSLASLIVGGAIYKIMRPSIVYWL